LLKGIFDKKMNYRNRIYRVVVRGAIATLTQIASVVFISVIISCGGSNNTDDSDEHNENTQVQRIEEQPTSVSTSIISEDPFYSELIANGKLTAVQRADLHFQMSGMITSVLVSEGQQVVQGQILARLDDTEQRMAHKQLVLDKQKAGLEYEDHLLRLGYRLQDTAVLDVEIKKMARLRSGLTAVDIAMEKNRLEMDKLTLRAPFAGRVANLKIRPHNMSNNDAGCTIVGTQNLSVEFKVLEQELPNVDKGRIVQVTPFSVTGKSYTGKISSINPMVDASGMVTVHAIIANDGSLLDGMTVNVSAKKLIGNMISIPKEAVLDRQDRKVVFTVNNGTAKWNYVEIAYENSSHYAIRSGLNVGDSVIYQGNFNLAHDKKIRVEND